MAKIKVAILGPGNIGIDLMKKIFNRSKNLELVLMAGIEKQSKGLTMAAELWIDISSEGVAAILKRDDIRIVFEATSAKAHVVNSIKYKEKNKIAIDLTPAAVGPYIVPSVNLGECLNSDNVNLVTCGGQATVPIIFAISRVQTVEYAETVSTIASMSAGPGTRANIDEFTVTTSRALHVIGKAVKSKSIIVLNPAEPPILMRNTIYAKVLDPDIEQIQKSVFDMEKAMQKYVPGYKVIMAPVFDGEKITTMIQVTGAGDYLPVYAGNLDIITCAALRVGDAFAEKLLREGEGK